MSNVANLKVYENETNSQMQLKIEWCHFLSFAIVFCVTSLVNIFLSTLNETSKTMNEPIQRLGAMPD